MVALLSCERREGSRVRRLGSCTGVLGLLSLLLGGCVAQEPGATAEDAGIGSAGFDASAGTTDPHSGHTSGHSGTETHAGSGHDSTDSSHDAEHTSGAHTGSNSHGSQSDHGTETGHDSTHGTGEHGSQSTDRTDTTHTATGHDGSSDHTDTTLHTDTDHTDTTHATTHGDTSTSLNTTHGNHSDSNQEESNDDVADASISDDADTTDASEQTHDHTDVELSDEGDDAGLDSGIDTSSHDHDTSEADAAATSTASSTDHTHTSTNTSTSAASSGDTSSSTGTTGDTTSHHTDHEVDHCVEGYEPHPSDATMGDGWDVYIETRNGVGYPDATIQTEAIEWMEQHYWQEAHFQWHQARRCPKSPTSDPNDIEICTYPQFVKSDNECENNANGVEFLAMHRHMIQTLKQLWPNHSEQFEGWDTFPIKEDYPELLQDYFENWRSGVLAAANIADNIEANVGLFADEGAFGKWIQCGDFFAADQRLRENLHGALHFNGYSRDNQGHSVANQKRNLDAYLFWKLHGWIDKIWERYRVAKGLTNDLEPVIVEQCQEMHALSELVESLWEPVDPGPDPDPDPEDVVESGYFHEVVRPFLEDAGCRGCHGEASPFAGLQLGFLTSTEIVEQLVNQPSQDAVGQTLVVPGNPDQSWFYLKISGGSIAPGAESIQCQPSAPECHQPMPQGNGPMSEAAQEAIYQWIVDGALPPTIESD